MSKSSSHTPPAILNVENGEEIAGMWVSPHIPDTGIYKLIAKRKNNGKYEWAHFVQRDNGMKEKVYRGEVDTKEQLEKVHEIMDRNLNKIFGSHIHLQIATYDMYTVDGIRNNGSVN